MTNVHANSKDAFASTARTRNTRTEQVLKNVREKGAGTDREIMKRMGFFDPNAVRPRITELIREERLVEIARTQDALTGMSVRVVDIPGRQVGQMRMF